MGGGAWMRRSAVTYPLTSGWMVIGKMKFSSSLLEGRMRAREGERVLKKEHLYR